MEDQFSGFRIKIANVTMNVFYILGYLLSKGEKLERLWGRIAAERMLLQIRTIFP